MKPLTFQNQKLEIDYIAFKFEALDWFQEKEIFNYFFRLGFNTHRGLPPKITQDQFNPNNRFAIYFSENIDQSDGKVLHFTGKNGKYFYELLKRGDIHWKFFEAATLARLDIAFLRHQKKSDKISVSQFFLECFQKMERSRRKTTLVKNNAGLITKIGHRSSSRYFRIYQTDNRLKFEYELKKDRSDKYRIFFLQNQLEEFENSLSLDFITQFGKLLPLKYCYLDWLVSNLRPFRKRRKQDSSRRFNTDYIGQQNFSTLSKRKAFWNLLQFLEYSQKLTYTTDYLGETRYRRVLFPVQDFLKYKNESTNHYQLRKILSFFQELQINSLLKYFTDTSYQSLVTIPKVELSCRKYNRWTAEVWIGEDLFYYAHPFLFPDLFHQKLTKHQFEVQFKIIQVFATADLEKVFLIEDYFQNYPSTLSNAQKTKIKNYFIEVIQRFEEDNLIDNHYQIFQNGQTIQTKKLTAKNIHEGFIISETLDL